MKATNPSSMEHYMLRNGQLFLIGGYPASSGFFLSCMRDKECEKVKGYHLKLLQTFLFSEVLIWVRVNDIMQTSRKSLVEFFH